MTRERWSKTENVKRELGVPAKLFEHLVDLSRHDLKDEYLIYKDTMRGIMQVSGGEYSKQVARVQLDQKMVHARDFLRSEVKIFMQENSPGVKYLPIHFNRGAAKYVADQIYYSANGNDQFVRDEIFSGVRFVLPAVIIACIKEDANPNLEFVKLQDSFWTIIYNTATSPSTDLGMFETGSGK